MNEDQLYGFTMGILNKIFFIKLIFLLLLLTFLKTEARVNNKSFILAEMRYEMMDYRGALSKYETALEDFKNETGSSDEGNVSPKMNLIRTYERIGDCYEQIGDKEKASEYRNLAIEELNDIKGDADIKNKPFLFDYYYNTKWRLGKKTSKNPEKQHRYRDLMRRKADDDQEKEKYKAYKEKMKNEKENSDEDVELLVEDSKRKKLFVGIKAGMNFPSYDGADISGKSGINLFLYGEYFFTRKNTFSFISGLGYITKGFTSEYNGNTSKISMSYLQLPIMVSWFPLDMDIVKPKLTGGFEFGFLMGNSYTNETTGSEEDYGDGLSSIAISFVLSPGIEYPLGNSDALTLDLLFGFGLNKSLKAVDSAVISVSESSGFDFRILLGYKITWDTLF